MTTIHEIAPDLFRLSIYGIFREFSGWVEAEGESAFRMKAMEQV